jgi:hypothetical protein
MTASATERFDDHGPLRRLTGSPVVVWLDALDPLTAYGPVIAPDLPGAVLGHTEAPHPSVEETGFTVRNVAIKAAGPLSIITATPA